MRLIDAKRLEANIKEAFRENPVVMGIMLRWVRKQPTADVAPVVHGRCPVCSGKKVLAQDCDNGYCVEIDTEQAEMTIWQGDTCLAVISIDFCPNCGARMDGDGDAEKD